MEWSIKSCADMSHGQTNKVNSCADMSHGQTNKVNSCADMSHGQTNKVNVVISILLSPIFLKICQTKMAA